MAEVGVVAYQMTRPDEKYVGTISITRTGKRYCQRRQNIKHVLQ